MIKVLIHGIKGAMGQHVFQQLNELEDFETLGYEKNDSEESHIFDDYEAIGPVDVIIDFSHHSLIDDLLDYAKQHLIPTVICTTGLTEDTERLIQTYKERFPIFKSGNMSLGINVLLELAKIGARSLADYDVEIIEKHHSQKVDAPSGTAYMIADQIKKERQELEYVYGREGNAAKRHTSELGIHAVRGGSITGDHTVLFAGLDEIIEIKHQATSKAVFAKGAIEAAQFLINQPAGLYNMSDLILGGL